MFSIVIEGVAEAQTLENEPRTLSDHFYVEGLASAKGLLVEGSQMIAEGIRKNLWRVKHQRFSLSVCQQRVGRIARQHFGIPRLGSVPRATIGWTLGLVLMPCAAMTDKTAGMAGPAPPIDGSDIDIQEMTVVVRLRSADHAASRVASGKAGDEN
jgi:hypothetical protein